MVREDHMIHTADRIAWHVAAYTVIAGRLPGRLRRAAIGGLMAGQALGAEVRRFFRWRRNRMRIVAGAAPKLLAARALTCALRQVLGVAGHLPLRHRTCADENRHAVRERLAGRKR